MARTAKEDVSLSGAILNPEYLNLLVASTRVDSANVIEALRLHLVEGHPRQESATLAGCKYAQFRRGLIAVSERHDHYMAFLDLLIPKIGLDRNLGIFHLIRFSEAKK
ncbi:hypothetical protein ACYPKM_02580 [Pseudomonas aeruginosa]